MVSEFSWLPWRCVGETWLPVGSTVLSSQINSPLPADEYINPKFTHMHPLGRHLCWRSQPERIATVAGKQETWRDPEVLTPGKLLSRTDICPLIGVVRGKEGAGRVLGDYWLSFHCRFIYISVETNGEEYFPQYLLVTYIVFSLYKLPLNAFH